MKGFKLSQVAGHVGGFPFLVTHASGVAFIVSGMDERRTAYALHDPESQEFVGWASNQGYPRADEASWQLSADLRSHVQGQEEVELLPKDGWESGKVVKKPKSDFDLGGVRVAAAADTIEVQEAAGYVVRPDDWHEGEVQPDAQAGFEPPSEIPIEPADEEESALL